MTEQLAQNKDIVWELKTPASLSYLSCQHSSSVFGDQSST